MDGAAAALKAGVPDAMRTSRTKPEIALDEIDRLIAAGKYPRGLVSSGPSQRGDWSVVPARPAFGVSCFMIFYFVSTQRHTKTDVSPGASQKPTMSSRARRVAGQNKG